MSKTERINYRRGPRGSRKAERYITVRGERRDPPDLRKLSRASSPWHCATPNHRPKPGRP